MTVEDRVTKLEYKLDHSVEEIMSNMNRLHNHEEKINDNSQRITQNSGALEILKTFKSDSHKFFIMWLITFIALLGMIGYVIYLSNDIRTVTTQEVEQDTGEGSNYFVGGDVEG